MTIAIQETIPWVKKCLQNFLRSSSSDAAICLNEPSIEECAHFASSKSDIAFASKTNGSTGFVFFDINEITAWYDKQNKQYKLLLDDCGVNDLSIVDNKQFTELGLGLKYVGQLISIIKPPISQ